RQWDYPYGWAPHQMLIWIKRIRTIITNRRRTCLSRA
ncbi:MAG: hypothetical protein KJ583_04900, partial [Nanoarchaeota archaeon]|nr:hypothetical protein [Nanoarchaeota archaeon]MBU1604628.1 hypothetical protein [Nanoarchaeota archaeon]